MAVADGAQEAVEVAFGEILEPGEILTGWVLVASLIDSDGDQRLYTTTMEGQTRSTDIGLLEYASIGARRAIEREWDREFDEDED